MNDHGMTFRDRERMAEYRARVISINDPKGWLRAQVRVPGWWDGVRDQDLPWAEYRLTSARPNGGDFEPAEVGDWVWVDFPNSDTRYPRITGWCHFAPGGVPNLPHEAFRGPEGLTQQRLSAQPLSAKPPYHGARVSTKHGTTVERAPDGSCRVTQRSSGTGVEITPDGHIVIYGAARTYRSSTDDTTEQVGGNLKIEVAGDIQIEAGGNIKITGQRIDLN